ncbi:SHOCT domain-containing protein [Deinococcus hopiensis]|uniref:SHOCT domain-containing protein n=1 Tax=Deinococcus hopiensis KR-140 TaxID=695939 RepID=A0A1W1VIW1_9DEIO|nr:SHOCT domain-containing protein [Deinococcus hopiensis]SMB93266.1 hypothetical protein SAMN00790413_01910 [Deinococcus hopiensis KR-140]
MLELMVAIVLGTTIWMGYDSAQHKIAVDSKPYSANNGAAAWVLSGIFLWIATFPYYLVKRSRAVSSGSIAAPPIAPAPARPLSEELAALSDLRAAGKISEADYERAKSKLLK